jgi:hypothetical protein
MAECLNPIRLYHFYPPKEPDASGSPAYNRAVSDVPNPGPSIKITPIVSALKTQPTADADDTMRCERCGSDMYRMHAVWRCPNCRFKTDCCGW